MQSAANETTKEEVVNYGNNRKNERLYGRACRCGTAHKGRRCATNNTNPPSKEEQQQFTAQAKAIIAARAC